MLGPGDVLGEVASLDGEPCSATATALGQVRVYRLGAASLVRMRLGFEPALYKVFRNLTVTLCGRLRQTLAQIEALSTDPALMARVQRQRRLRAEARGLDVSPGGPRGAKEVGADRLVALKYDAGASHPSASTMADFLRQIPIFQSLDGAEMEALADALREERHPAGAVIAAEGGRGGAFCLVAEGRVEAHREDGEGGTRVVSIFEAGAMFGEVALIDGGAHPVTCVALTDAVVLTLAQRDFEWLWSTNSPLAFRFVEIVGMDLSLSLRGVDRSFAEIFASVDRMAPEHLDRLAEMSALLEMKSVSTGALRKLARVEGSAEGGGSAEPAAFLAQDDDNVAPG